LNDFLPFGQARYQEGGVGGDKLYIGKYHDDQTGLEFLEARYYNSTNGQFISQDPSHWTLANMKIQLYDPQSWNSYGYARNNPLIYKDATGEFWTEVVLTQMIAKMISVINNAIISLDRKIEPSINVVPQNNFSVTQPPTPVSSNLDIQGGENLRSDYINITFDPGVDHKVNMKLSSYFKILMKNLVGSGIESVNISSTTRNGGSKTSAHEYKNGGLAFDVNFLNKEHVNVSDNWSSVFQNIVSNTYGYLENYGPVLTEKIINGKPYDASGWARDTSDGKDGHYTHIHVSVDSNNE